MNNINYKLIVLIPVLLIFNLTFLIKNCSSQWVQTYGFSVGSGNSIATFGNNYICVGTQQGIYLSSNNGTNWTQTT